MKGLALLLPIFLLSIASVFGNCVKGNCDLGTGTYKFNDGSIYTGEFDHKNPHGKGKILYANGDTYDGSFHNGVRAGEGTYVYKSTTKYIGNFRSNKFHGKGRVYFSSGAEYIGDWVSNKFHGKGRLTEKDGSIYTGEFSKGKKHGSGTLVKSDNKKINGIWKNNKLVKVKNNTTFTATKKKKKKPVVTYIPSKENNTLSYKNCNKQYCHQEEGKFTYGDGSYYIGNFVKGSPEGQGNCYYANGDVYEGGWKNHSPEGQGVMTFISGRKYSAFWKAGHPTRQLYQKPKKKEKRNYNPSKEADGKIDMYALVIGVSSYNHMPVLKYTDDDAYQLYAFLKSPEGGALEENHITILIDEVATKENIRTSMKNLFEKADKDDVVIMYYSGHGLQGRFLPYDFDGYNNSLPHSEIYDLLNASQAKNKIVIADACYSGSLEAEKTIYAPSLTDFYNKIEDSDGGTAILMSSKAEEVSLEYSGLRQGVFSHFLLKGLHGWADADDDHIVSISELYRYISVNVKDYTGNRQSPLLSGRFDQEMPVAMVRK